MSAEPSPALHALLVTDVVDSTRLLEELGDVEMSRWWAVHDRLARDLLPVWRGREIDKTDGMLLLFEGADDAVGYAVAYQRAITTERLPFAVRAGLHVGRVSMRANPPEDVARGAKPVEVIGLALPAAARVMSVALGGQTLLSADAAKALHGDRHTLQSHGYWRLQGLAEPIELFEAGHESTNFRCPPDTAKACRVVRQGHHWMPLSELRHSLPAERDSFVGRRDALQALTRKLERGARLVSVLGMGGSGKTRLATYAGWSLLGRYPGGVWFCDLSAARTVEGIHFAVAQGLDVPLGSTDPVLQLAHAIDGHGHCLIVLDNFEQVASHAEATLGQWLDRAPQAQFLVTTREVLGVTGEELLSLPPLNPDDAAELFAKRAAAARLGYLAGDEDAAAIRQLVKVLDGLPLAIELAAARVRTMAPRFLVARMRDRFELLRTRGARHDRQATLRATFDWSWELLADGEKQALAVLSVFEGGFTLDAAEELIAAVAPATSAGARTLSADALVPALLDKSLVRQVADERFDLLETVREYAAGQLQARSSFAGSGPACAARARKAHWDHFAAFDETRATANRCADAHNLLAACRAATQAGDADAAVGNLVAAWAALRQTGPYRVVVQLAQDLVARGDLGEGRGGLVHWVAADALELLGDVAPAQLHIAQGLASAAQVGDTACRARLLLVRGRRNTLDGELEAGWEDLTETHRLAVALGHPRLQILALNELGLHMDHQARWAEARDCYERGLGIARQLGEARLEGGLLGNLGGLHHDRGELDAARTYIEQGLQLAMSVGDRRWAGNARCNLGLVLQQQGHFAEARAHFEQALRIAGEVGHVRLEYTVRCNLGILTSTEGRHEEAGIHLQRAVDAAMAAADRRAEGQFRGYLALNLARGGKIEDARTALEAGERLLSAMADRLSEALLLCDRAEVEMLDDHPAAAREAIDTARSIATELECGAESELGRRLASLSTPPPQRPLSC